MHRSVVAALAPKGVFVLEAYTPAQLEYRTGGPPTVDLLVAAEDLRQELEGLEFLRFEEKVRNVLEGKLHKGRGAVIQVIAVKPAG